MFQALLAQSYDYSYNSPTYTYTDTTGSAAGITAVFIIVYLIFLLALLIPSILGGWKMFVKAGQPGWKILVPFYNLYTILQIVGRPTVWMAFLAPMIVLLFVPVLNILVAIPLMVFEVILAIDLAKSFGKDAGWGVLLFFFSPVVAPILGFGSAKYVGPSVKPATESAAKPAKQDSKDDTENE